MKCPNCQNDIYDEAKYCPYCGHSIEEHCPKCGSIISLNDKFCSQCGYSLKSNEKIEGYYVPIDHQKEDLNEAYHNIFEENQYNDYHDVKKEKIRWKPIIIGLTVLALLTGASLFYLGTLSKDNNQVIQPDNPTVNNDNSYATYIGNANLEGKAVLDDDIIYMSNNDGYLVSFDKEFKESNVLLEEAVSYITPYKDKIYFADSQNYLSVIDKDGKNKEVIIQKAVYYLLLKDNKLYYQLDPDNESLYVMDLNTREMIKLNDCRSYCPNVSQDSIYYTSTDGIYVMGLDGSDDKRIVAGEVYTLLYEDNKLYYVQNDYTLTIYDLKNGSTETISNMLVSKFNKNGDTLIAITSRGLVKYDLNTKKSKTLYTGNIDGFQMIGDAVLVEYNNTWQLIDSNGNQYSLFEENNGEFI